eukprot:TRINITY_DN1518_c0_g1_i1.p2 TRINITY_DN1518_c0_g1~~TRINITY_DN1518_c0_g1_i1.p2  ORF type:complete len:390 (+),score=145.90 TRINITY_DN1518_c0_g1_i1:64-1233(+)
MGDLDSSADDLRLKENVKAVLIREGAMGKMRAQMRECVLKVLQKTGRPLYVASDRCKAVREDAEAGRGYELVRDYLAHHDLAYTESVLRGEASMEAADVPPLAIPDAARQRLSGKGSLLSQILEDWLVLASGAAPAAPAATPAAAAAVSPVEDLAVPAYNANEHYSSDSSGSAHEDGPHDDAATSPSASRHSASPRSQGSPVEAAEPEPERPEPEPVAVPEPVAEPEPEPAVAVGNEDSIESDEDLVNSGPPLPEADISAILPDDSSNSSDAALSPTRVQDAPASQQPAQLDPQLAITPESGAPPASPPKQDPAPGAAQPAGDDDPIESYDSDDYKEEVGATIGGGDDFDDDGFDEYADDDDDDSDDVKLTKDDAGVGDFEDSDDSDAF